MIGQIFNSLIFQPIFNLLLVLYSLVGDFGIAVILFTIVVKLLLFPLLKSQTLQMKKMQDLQPEINKIKRKTKGNKQLEYLMTMNLYKQNNVKMSASFFSILIQLPILIAMFSVVRVTITSPDAISQWSYGFVRSMAPIQNLISNHASFKPMLFGVIDLSVIPFQFNAGIHTFFTTLFVVGAAWTQYYIVESTSMNKHTKSNRRIRDILAEAGEGKEPDQSEINSIMATKMNKVMPIMILVSFGMVYGVIGFFQFISGIIAILQRKFILSKIDEVSVQPVNQAEVEERLKRVKAAEVVLQNRQKQIASLKKIKKSKG